MPDSLRLQFEAYLERLKEPKIKNLDFEAYRLHTSYALSSINHTFLFQKQDSISSLIFKEHEYDDKNKNYKTTRETRIILSATDWEHLQYLIYKFEFWTEKEYEIVEVADGFSYVLEGNRPQAKICSKKANKIIFRINSKDSDNIKWLCDDLISIYLHKDEI